MLELDQLGSYIYRGLLTLALSLLIVSGVGMMILTAKNLEILSVQSNSMVPVFQRGDALIVAPTQAKALKPGQIVSYLSPLNEKVIVSHRLLERDSTGQLITSGDATGSLDQPISPDRLVGKATAVAPGLGKLIDITRSPIGGFVLIILPALLLVVLEIRHLALSLSYVRYRLYITSARL